MNEKAKKALNIAFKIGSWIVIGFTVIVMIFTMFSMIMLDKNERNLFGTKFYIVQSDSMSLSENNKDMDVHFNAGDIILVKAPKNSEDVLNLQPGDIISFISENPDSWGETITHMIHSVEKDKLGNVIGYRTYGTNTGVVDEKTVTPDFILGTYRGRLPAVGRFFAFMKTTPGYICCILLPFLLIIFYHAMNVITLFRQYKGEQTAAINAEKEQLEKDREENQRMMAELLALKAKLEEKDVIPGSVEKAVASEQNSDTAAVTNAVSTDLVTEAKDTDNVVTNASNEEANVDSALAADDVIETDANDTAIISDTAEINASEETDSNEEINANEETHGSEALVDTDVSAIAENSDAEDTADDSEQTQKSVTTEE